MNRSSRVAVLILAFLVRCFGVSLPEIASRMALSRLPDTVDYRMTTTIRAAGQVIVSRAHIIQAGSDLQWMETEGGGRRLRIIRNGAKMSTIDLASGKMQNMAVPPAGDRLAFVRNPFASGEWLEPSPAGGDLWAIHDTIAKGDVKRQTLYFSMRQGVLVGATRIGMHQDTTRLEIHWNVVQGKNILDAMDVIVSAGGKTAKTEIVYSDWVFPRAIGRELFVVP